MKWILNHLPLHSDETAAVQIFLGKKMFAFVTFNVIIP